MSLRQGQPDDGLPVRRHAFPFSDGLFSQPLQNLVSSPNRIVRGRSGVI
jgi:hypothetical protein